MVDHFAARFMIRVLYCSITFCYSLLFPKIHERTKSTRRQYRTRRFKSFMYLFQRNRGSTNGRFSARLTSIYGELASPYHYIKEQSFFFMIAGGCPSVCSRPKPNSSVCWLAGRRSFCCSNLLKIILTSLKKKKSTRVCSCSVITFVVETTHANSVGDNICRVLTGYSYSRADLKLRRHLKIP